MKTTEFGQNPFGTIQYSGGRPIAKAAERANHPIVLDPWACAKHKAVLIKMSVKDKALIPLAIERRRRESDQDVDKRHAEQAAAIGKAELGEVGRERVGRVDTGVHAIDNLGPVQVALLVKGLASNGYHLTDAHCFTKVKRYAGSPELKSDRTHVIVLVFTYSEDRVELLPELSEALLELRKRIWQYVHVWDNAETHGTVTVNLGGPLNEIAPKWALVVRNRTLKAIPVGKPVTTEEE